MYRTLVDRALPNPGIEELSYGEYVILKAVLKAARYRKRSARKAAKTLAEKEVT
jgi:hypothetical protein